MKRTLLSILSIVLLVCLLAACTGGDQQTGGDTSPTAGSGDQPSGDVPAPSSDDTPDDTTPATSTGKGPVMPDTTVPVDTSKHLNMTMYAVNDATGEDDKPKVMTEVNKYLNESINVTLKWLNIESANMQNKYPLILASDEVFDIIYTANWVNYNDHVRNGAFIAMDDLFQYAPQLVDTVPEHFWAGMRGEDGHFYAMPSTWQYPRGVNVGYREDLRVKWGLPEIKSIETLTQFYDAAVENLSSEGYFPINYGSTGNIAGIYANYHDNLDCASVGKGSNNIFMAQISKPEAGFRCYWFDEDFDDWVVMMKEWMEKGYWSRSTLSNQTSAETAFQNGTSASYTGHYDSMRGGINATLKKEKAVEEGWDCWVWRNDEMLPSGTACWINSLQDCVSIPRQAQSPERSILLIEQLNCVQEVSDLIQRGIEGVHWTATEDGKSFVAADQKGFGMNAWCFRNAKTYRDGVYIWPRYDEYDKLHRQNTIAAYTEGFRFKGAGNFEDFITEVDTVLSEFSQQLQLGMAADPKATLETARQRIKDAGVDEYLAAVNAEWAVYYQEELAP